MHFKKMLNSLKGLLLIGALLLLFTFNASNTFADFYVIAGSRGVGTKINALPYVIASPGFYFIDKDLSCALGRPGISISADNVTLDLMGFSLVGPGGTSELNPGIRLRGANVEIRNGTIRNFPGGIREDYFGEGYHRHRIINIRVKDNGYKGISLIGISNLIEQCTAVNNDEHGIYVFNMGTVTGTGSTVTGNTCYRNGEDGISVGAGSTVTGNTCYRNGEDGISVGAGSTVTGNTCYKNTIYGIYAESGSTVAGNTCNENGNNGIYTFGTGFTVTGNTCYNNGHHGIYADVGSTVIGNTCCDNTSHYGIYLNGNNFVDQNTTYGNGTNMNTDCASCTFGKNHAP